MISTLAIYLAYLSLPTLLLVLSPRRGREAHPVAAAAAAVALWLPIEFSLLPALRIAAAGGFNVGPLVAISAAFVLFLVVRPLDGIGFTFRLTLRDLALALGAIAIYGIVAVPLGLASDFLSWNPRMPRTGLLTPVLIYLLTALPEEFLFRGIFQNLLTRWVGPAAGLLLAAILFGFAHLPDYRYVALAALAGLAYGTVYARTGKITASAITHAGVNTIWAAWLRAPV